MSPPTNGGTDPLNEALKTNSEPSANYFEAPKLFNPNDRTAARVAAPVRNAVYERPTSYRPISTSHSYAAPTQQVEPGWTSGSN